VSFEYSRKFLKKIFKGVKDSKKLTAEKREMWLEVINAEKKAERLLYAVSSVSAKTIDNIGIAPSIRKALEESLRKLKIAPARTLVLLDGGLHAPAHYTHQKTIIKGDEKEIIISLASIIAKVHRDRYMTKIAKDFPKYDLDIHKGYGTKKHISTIKKYGSSIIHRKSFLKL